MWWGQDFNPGSLVAHTLIDFWLQFCFCLVSSSCPTLCGPMDCNPPGSSVHGIAQAGILEYCHLLLQGIFLTQGWNPCLPHWQVILHRWAPREAPWLQLLRSSEVLLCGNSTLLKVIKFSYLTIQSYHTIRPFLVIYYSFLFLKFIGW